jgi:uncharacterized alpha-E superfamily protein
MYSRLRYGKVQDITRRGLHRFLTDFINRNVMVSNEIAKTFYLASESQGQSQSQSQSRK